MNDTDDTTDNDTADGPRPLGYWLITLDRLLTEQMDAALEAEDSTRREWMILSALAADVDAPGFLDRLSRNPYRLRGLVDRGWVAQTDGEWQLSETGRQEYEQLANTIATFRERVANAVPEEDFRTTLRSLEAIARELGWDESRFAPEEDPHGSRHEMHGHGGFGHGGFGHGFDHRAHPHGGFGLPHHLRAMRGRHAHGRFDPHDRFHNGFHDQDGYEDSQGGDDHDGFDHGKMHGPHGHGHHKFGRRGFGRGPAPWQAHAMAAHHCDHASRFDPEHDESGFDREQDGPEFSPGHDGPAWHLRRESAARLRFARRHFGA